MRDRKYKYLYQLILTSIILVIIPILFFYSIVWKKTIHEIDYVNEEYQNNALNYFFGYFTNEVTEFKNKIVEFAATSRTSQIDGGVFYQGTEVMEAEAYYYGKAARDLSEFAQEFGFGDMGAYYYEKDFVLSNKCKYPFESYLKDGLELPNDEREAVLEFFSIDEFENRKIMIAPLDDEAGVSTECLVGVCTFLGKNREKVLMFYQIDINEDYLGLALWGTQSKYYIVDDESLEIVLSIGASKEDYQKIYSILQKEDLEELIERPEYFVRANKNMDVTFILDISEDTVQNKVLELYASVRLFFAYILLIMAGICIAIVYLNYKPLQGLLRKIEYKGKNEFDAILNAWEKQNDLLTEQRMAIMDLLMNHLLYGIPISHRYTERLGVSNDITKYCVFVIRNHVLKVAEMEELTQKVEETFGVLLFVNDLIGEKATVCIAFMEKDKSEMIKEWMSIWCQSRIEVKYELRTGHTVDRLSDIQKSFSLCGDSGESEDDNNHLLNEIADAETLSEKVRKRIVINEKLKEKILNYLDENFMDRELSQQQVADRFEISVYSLSKMFNGQIGTGFVEYINSKRIEQAKKLLLTTEKSVKDIALIVGFAGSKYFTEIFKKYTGTTPGEFRVEDKNNQEGGVVHEEKQ